MRIPSWRVALTGAVIVVLLLVGIGAVAASSQAPASQPSTALAAPSASPGAAGGNGPLRTGFHGFLKRAEHLGRRLVHATATVTDKDGNLIELQFDHGTISAVGGGSLTISEAGGGSVTVSTDSSTVVRIGFTTGALSDLKVGDEVFVQSRIDGSTLAKHIFKFPTTS